MKKFFFRIAVLCFMAGLTLAVIILIPLPKDSYHLAIIDKHELLVKTPGPKLVLAGGSNLAFGIDSNAIEEALHVPVVNMGINAGFGLGRILDDLSPFLHSGDTLVIAPEYSHFVNGWNGDSVAYEMIFDARQYRLFIHCGSYELPSNFSGYTGTHLKGLIARFRPPDPLAYSRYGFNEHGDYVKHLDAENRSVSPEKPLGKLSKTYLARFFGMVDSFAGRGIRVLVSYPSYEETSFRNNSDLIRELDGILRAEKNLTVVSTPQDYSFPIGLFYDTVYHLNAGGRRLRTERLVRDLRASGLFNVK
jgi:hypothetical protein